MWYAPSIVTPATAEPVTLAEAKAHLRVDNADEDAVIGGYIAAARDYVEKYTGTFIMPCRVRAFCDSFSDCSRIPMVPLDDVVEISCTLPDGSAHIVSDTIYEVRADGLTAAVVLKQGQTWPSILAGSRIAVTVDVGYGSVPPAIRHAILLLLGDFYRGRENTSIGSYNQPAEMPHAATALLTNWRAWV